MNAEKRALKRECKDYREMGRRGERGSSGLTAASTRADIRAAANVTLERIRASIHTPTEEAVFEDIGRILEAFERAYVKGLRDRERHKK